MFSIQKNINSNVEYAHLIEMEDDAWLRFIAKLFPLLESMSREVLPRMRSLLHCQK